MDIDRIVINEDGKYLTLFIWKYFMSVTFKGRDIDGLIQELKEAQISLSELSKK